MSAHDGLWEAAIAMRDDLAGRLAIVAPLVLAALGLGVTLLADAKALQGIISKTI